ncbi:hypothetical protein EDS67_15810 [candidate division KSB1 bacterium]|nr:MAG: hypothetical protein EDS67_15810 [candidate division KSB1 bacterium]MBC6947756.1 hypothetical protein [candidate division KSB1 bacterium]MCE7942569.1 hypothetical protein [Chlorobi bacterium CHB1]
MDSKIVTKQIPVSGISGVLGIMPAARASCPTVVCFHSRRQSKIIAEGERIPGGKHAIEMPHSLAALRGLSKRPHVERESQILETAI